MPSIRDRGRVPHPMGSKKCSVDFSSFPFLCSESFWAWTLWRLSETQERGLIVTLTLAWVNPVSKPKFLKVLLSAVSQRFPCGFRGSGGTASACPSSRTGIHGQGLETGNFNCEKTQGQACLAVEMLSSHFQVLLLHPHSVQCFSASPVPEEI